MKDTKKKTGGFAMSLSFVAGARPPVYVFLLSSLCSLYLCGSPLFADAPVASYVFPAGGQRGTTVKVRVGGLFLHEKCNWELLGPGVTTSKELRRTRTIWFEGPRLPLPDSQQAEDYPQDMLGEVRIAADAAPGLRRGRLWTSEGAASGLGFMVGELPEVVEQEVDGDPVAVEVKLPVAINGRIFPRGNVDIWTVSVRKGETVTCEVHAERLGSPLDSRLEVRDPSGKIVAENDDAVGKDSRLHFTASADGKYQVRITDAHRRGGQSFVYRLTLTTGPFVERVYPLGGKRGSTVRLSLSGPSVPREPMEIALPAGAGSTVEHRFTIGGKQTNPVRLDLDELPEYLESEPNDEPAKAPLVATPAVVNGRIDRPGDVDCWRFRARKGEVLALQLRARRLGSPLLGVIEVCDAAGKSIVRAESDANRSDPELTFTAAVDGTYCARVRERFRSRGGPAFAYRLRLAAPAPDFHLALAADALTLVRGKTVAVQVHAKRRGGFNGPITLHSEGLPAGVKAANLLIPAGQTVVNVTLTAGPTAPIAATPFTFRGSATVSGKTVTRTATLPGEPKTDTILLGVALPVPFKVVGVFDLRLAPRGSVFRKRFKVVRGGYTGPLVARLADRQARHLQGVTGPVVTIPAGVEELEYPVTLPPWMETGRTSRACVMVTGVVKDGGAEHTVSFTSQAQNEQLVAVVETGRLGLEAGPSSLAARPGAEAGVALRVRRGKGLRGPVKVELVCPNHVRGVRAEPVVIPADRSDGTLKMHFGRGALGPFNAPLLLRAALATKDGPAVAEAKLEVVREE
jgi:hypothetical protein